MTEHSPWDELAVGLALGALEPEDEETFMAHLRSGCPQCARTVADMEAVAGELAYAAPADEPPPALLESIMREVRATERAASPLSRVLPEVAQFRPRRMRSDDRAPGRNATWLARAAVLVLVVGLAGWNYQLRADNDVKQRSLANAAAAARLMADPASTKVPLESKGSEHATVIVKGDEAFLVVDNFARNDDENTIYVLWSQNHGSETMVGVDSFKIVHDEPAYIPVRNELGDTAAIAAFAISKETGTQIPATPSEPIAVGKTGSAT